MIWHGVAVGMLLAGSAPGPDVDRVLRKHEENFAGVHSLRGTVEGKRSDDGGKTSRPMYEIKFLRSGRRERVHSKQYGSLYDGKWRDGIAHVDNAYTPAETRTLGGIDPNGPRPRLPLAGADVSTIRGNIMAPMPAATEGRKLPWAAYLMINPDPRYSLRDLYTLSKKKDVRRGVDKLGAPTWEFSLESPDGAFTYEVTVSPEHGYLISRLETHYIDKTPGAAPFSATRTVAEYLTDGSGLTLPARIESHQVSANTEDLVVTLKDIEVNRPIADEELALDFPAGAIVVNFVEQKYHLWGEQGPSTTFATPQAFNDWNQRRMIALERPARPGLGEANPAILTGLTLAMGGLFVYRRSLRRGGDAPA